MILLFFGWLGLTLKSGGECRVEDAVIRYLNRRPAKASDGPGNNS